MTEEEAKTKDCCDPEECGVDMYDTSDGRVVHTGERLCAGSQCMAWRWVWLKSVAAADAPSGVSMYVHGDDGFCGLAGQAMIRMVALMLAAAGVWVVLVVAARAEIDPEKPDWPMIVGCAMTPFPKRAHPDDMSDEYRRKLDLFWEVRDCRLMLLARDAGWRAAGRPTSSNAYPPIGMVRPGDYGR